MRATTFRLSALLAAGCLALTACSGGGNQPAPSATSVATSTATLGDLKPGQPVDKDTFFAVTKAAADRSKTYRFATQIGQGGAVLKSQGVVDNADAGDRKRQITITDANGIESQMVIAGGQVYVKAAEGPDAKWTKSPISPQVEQVLEGAAQRIEADKELATGIVYVGEEDLAGVKTRHFRVTVDAAKASAAATSPATAPAASATATASPAPNASSPAATASGASSPTSATTVEYWLDDQNQTRKMVHVVSGMPTTTTYEKWGEPVTITVPAADQITGPTATGPSTRPTKS